MKKDNRKGEKKEMETIVGTIILKDGKIFNGKGSKRKMLWKMGISSRTH